MRKHNRIFRSQSTKVYDPPEQITNPVLLYLKWQLLILKSIGLLPFYSTVNFYKIGAPNRRWLLISKTIICTKVALNLLHLDSLLSPAILEILFVKRKTDGITNMLDVAFCLLSDVTISWTCACNTTKIIKIINRFLKVDQLLQQYPAPPAQKSNKINLFNAYLLLNFVYISLMVITFRRGNMSFISLYFFVCMSFYHVENATSCAFVVFISALMHLLAVRFQYVNQFLSQYESKILQKGECPPIEGFSRNAFMSSEVKLRLFAKNSKLIYGLHNDLLDLYKMINNYASLGLLAFLLYACSGMLSCIYYCSVYNWQTNKELHIFLWTLSWIPIFAGMVILLAMSCNSATKEANKTTQVLARVYGTGKDHQNIIDKFLTKSIKQEVHFTAYGFFVIDNTTLFKIFSGITTYLVILIQFKQLEESKADERNLQNNNMH